MSICKKVVIIPVLLCGMTVGGLAVAGDFGFDGPGPMGSEGSMGGALGESSSQQTESSSSESKSSSSESSNPCPTSCPEGTIELNTCIPFIGRCIKKDIGGGSDSNLTNAFPKLLGGMMRIVMTAVVVVGFLALLVGGLMYAMGGMAGTATQGKNLILKVIIGLILLGASGIILNLINPNFFGSSSQPGRVTPFSTLYR